MLLNKKKKKIYFSHFFVSLGVKFYVENETAGKTYLSGKKKQNYEKASNKNKPQTSIESHASEAVWLASGALFPHDFLIFSGCEICPWWSTSRTSQTERSSLFGQQDLARQSLPRVAFSTLYHCRLALSKIHPQKTAA